MGWHFDSGNVGCLKNRQKKALSSKHIEHNSIWLFQIHLMQRNCGAIIETTWTLRLTTEFIAALGTAVGFSRGYYFSVRSRLTPGCLLSLYGMQQHLSRKGSFGQGRKSTVFLTRAKHSYSDTILRLLF